VSKQEFEAETLILHPRDVPQVIATLAAAEVKFEADPTAIDPCGPTVFGTITGMTELNADELDTWLLNILDPLGGDLIECGFTQEIARWLNEANGVGGRAHED